MSKICSRCEKAVYPLEEVKCLDKVWHKLCFKCSECGMLLNMKNYKGYNKQPYCSAHYPKAKATSVAQTPEFTRIAQNTKLQSQVKYHEEFEKKIKGSKIEVTDDPETQRVMKVNALISQLEYTGKKTSTAPPLAVQSKYKGARNRADNPTSLKTSTNLLSSVHGPTPQDRLEKQDTGPDPAMEQDTGPDPAMDGLDTSKPKILGKLASEKTTNGDKFSPFSSRCVTNSTVYTSDGSKATRNSLIQGRIGSIADYDPLNENYGSLAQGYQPASRQSSQVEDQLDDDNAFSSPNKTDEENLKKQNDSENITGYSQEGQSRVEDDFKQQQEEEEQQDTTVVEEKNDNDVCSGTAPTVRPDIVGMAELLTDKVMDSVENNFKEQVHSHRREEDEEKVGECEGENGPGSGEAPVQHRPDLVPQEDKDCDTSAVTPEVIGVDDGEGGEIITTPLPGKFISLYDYGAQDDDEVSFSEDDIIVDVEKIDEGWLLGTVARTSQRGMLPANYVHLVPGSDE